MYYTVLCITVFCLYYVLSYPGAAVRVRGSGFLRLIFSIHSQKNKIMAYDTDSPSRLRRAAGNPGLESLSATSLLQLVDFGPGLRRGAAEFD